MTDRPIYVTRPFLPPLGELVPFLEEIWENRVLTNGGPFHQRLEEELAAYLGVPHVALFNNGMIALVTALQALGIEGEVITPPYSFAATSHALSWNGVTPVFADVQRTNLNLDPERIERAITPRTRAIMPVHCYGHPCDTTAIKAIADRHGLKVVYDAAHAFGVEDAGGGVLRHGDLAVLSFHATKVFNTFEGGAIVCHDAATKARIDQLKNFGLVDEATVNAAGLNGKMSEFNAALGLLQLRHIGDAIAARRAVASRYRELLVGVAGILCLPQSGETVANYSYFPILVGDAYGLSRDALYERLKAEGIFGRRYFYPLLSDMAPYRHLPSAHRQNLPVAADAAERILCLPIYPGLSAEDVDRIVAVIAAAAR